MRPLCHDTLFLVSKLSFGRSLPPGLTHTHLMQGYGRQQAAQHAVWQSLSRLQSRSCWWPQPGPWCTLPPGTSSNALPPPFTSALDIPRPPGALLWAAYLRAQSQSRPGVTATSGLHRGEICEHCHLPWLWHPHPFSVDVLPFA